MNRKLVRSLFALAVAAGATVGLAQMPMPHGTPGMCSGCEAMHRSMMGGMKAMENMQSSGNMDRDFATMMKIHHQGAVTMAEAELKSGKDPKMRAMAKRIIDAQEKEIQQFDDWLSKAK
jgi:uncharacterized protein (DUF305 family)